MLPTEPLTLAPHAVVSTCISLLADSTSRTSYRMEQEQEEEEEKEEEEEEEEDNRKKKWNRRTKN
jgi:ribosomal protein L12E/L44/L45/RPP1/RPP2